MIDDIRVIVSGGKIIHMQVKRIFPTTTPGMSGFDITDWQNIEVIHNDDDFLKIQFVDHLNDPHKSDV